MQAGEGAEPQVLIDPNTWSADGTIALGDLSFSQDGRYLAYAVQEAGSDWEVWRVMEVDTKKVLSDELRWLKFSGPAWTSDGRGFFYARFPEPAAGAAFQDLNLNQKVYYHRLGDAQADDVLVYARPDEPEWGFGCSVTEDGRYLVLTIYLGTDNRCQVYYRDLLAAVRDADADDRQLRQRVQLHRQRRAGLLLPDGPRSPAQTDRVARSPDPARLAGRSAAAERGAPVAGILAQQADAIEGVGLVGNQFIVETLHDAKTQVNLYSLAGEHVRRVELPGIGTAGGFGGKQTDTETFYSFSSFTTPPSIYRYDLMTGREHAAPAGQGQLRSGPVRSEAGLLHQQGRHARADVPRAQEGPEARRHEPDAAVRLRRVQHLADAGVLDQPAGVDGDGRRLRGGQPARRRRIRRRLAPGRHQAQQAERRSTTSSPPPSG